jgi:hypothetical protein
MITRRDAIAGAAAVGAVCVIPQYIAVADPAPQMLRFTDDVLARLPVECQAWLSSLAPGWRISTEYILNLIGEHNFARCWQVHRDELAELGFSFGFDPTRDD